MIPVNDNPAPDVDVTVGRAIDTLAAGLVHASLSDTQADVIKRLTVAIPGSTFHKKIARRLLRKVERRFYGAANVESLRAYVKVRVDTYISQGIHRVVGEREV